MTYDFNPLKKNLAKADEWLKKEFQQIRTGQASPAILDGVRVEVYGAPMGLKEVASVLIEGARTLRIAPWDLSQSKNIEKALLVADLGVSVAVDDQGLRVTFPDLTAERRAQIAKIAKEKMDEAKKEVRGYRDIVIRDLQAKEKEGGIGKDDIFRYKGDAQKLVDEANKRFEEAYVKKEKELLN